MRRVRTISWVILLLTVLVMAVSRFLTPLADWAVRADGILMLAAMAVFAFTAVRCAHQ